jgi:hypothetical protein
MFCRSSVICEIAYMTDSNPKKADDAAARYVDLGVTFGLLAGVIIGSTFLDNLATGTAVGLALGAGLGSVASAWSKKRSLPGPSSSTVSPPSAPAARIF